MYEESEAERYRKKLKDEYEQFVRNQDVYKTLLAFNKSLYSMIIETALQAFHCSEEDLKMDDLKELENYLKLARKKYHALVSAEDNGENIVISDEEDTEPLRHLESPVETNWCMPREIPSVTKNMNSNAVQVHQQPAVKSNLYGYNPQQNLMPPPWNPWMNHAPFYGSTSMQNVPRHPQFSLMRPTPPQLNPLAHFNTMAPVAPSPGFIYNQSMCPLPQIAQYTPQLPKTSRQTAQEKPGALSYREHRQQKLRKEAEEKKRRMQEHLSRKKQEEQQQERERNKQKEVDKEKIEGKQQQVSNFNIRRQQIADYNKRESDEQASTSSKQSESGKSNKSEGAEKKNKKSVRWADGSGLVNSESNVSSNNGCDKNAKDVDVLSNSSKAQSSSSKSSFVKSRSKLDREAAAKRIEDELRKALAPEKPSTSTSKVPESSKGKDKETSKKTDENPSDKDASKIGKLKVIHAKPIFKLLKQTDSFKKRKSNSPVKDDPQSKRLKEGDNEPSTSSCDNINDAAIEIKKEIMSDDENLDGKTDVSSNDEHGIQPNQVLGMETVENDQACIKLEPNLEMDETASTVKNVDIKEEVMSEIDQEGSSVHSEKLELNEMTEKFINVCENPEFLNTIAENFIDFSQFENQTDVANNNSSQSQMDSQDKCASWLEDIKNNDFYRTTESPYQEEQFYLTKDEEEEIDDIVPYYPVRQLGAAEIVPKEEQ